MDIDEALAHAINGDAVLFVGAGFAAEAKSTSGQNLPIGNQLAKKLMAECGDPGSNADLRIAASYFEKQKGRADLVSLLSNMFTVSTTTPAQARISQVRWKRIYTTNYDDVLETVYTKNGKPLVPVVLSQKPEDFASRPNLYVHLNGCVRGLTEAKLGSELKLTTVSYLTEGIADSTWALLFRSDIRAARSVIFLGYSLYDLDVQRILFADKATKDKCIFVVSTNATREFLADLSDFGTALPIGTGKFYDEFDTKSKTHVPIQEEPYFSCFEQISPPTSAQKPRDEDLLNLLLKGELRPEFVWHALDRPDIPDYYLVRQALAEVFDELSKSNDVVIHSDFANGKSAFAYGVALEAAANGVKPFLFTGPGRTLARELQQLAQMEGNVLVIFENYPRALTDIQQLCLQAKNDLRFLFSARSSDHDTYVDRLARSIGRRGLVEFDVNKLSPSDEEKLLRMLDTFGLWGKHAAESPQAKLRLIQVKYQSEFQKVLLDVLRSPVVIAKLREMMEGLMSDLKAVEVVTTLCALEIVQVTPRFSLVAELTDASILRRANFGGNPVLRQFFAIDRQQVLVKSPVLAHHLLTDVFDGDQTVDILLKIATRSEAASRLDPLMRQIFRELQAFSNIQFMLPEKNKRPLLIRYYENLKNTPTAVKNPFFWLQYAIARLSFGDFENAGHYFDTSYSLANDIPGFDSFQIDNHFARFMLERSVQQLDPEHGFSEFQKSDSIIRRQIADERRYFPYRVARNYRDIYGAFFSAWSSTQKEFFLKACQYVVDKIAELKGPLRNHRYVIDCQRRLSEIVKNELPQP